MCAGGTSDLRLALIHSSVPACKLTFVSISTLQFENKMTARLHETVSRNFL